MGLLFFLSLFSFNFVIVFLSALSTFVFVEIVKENDYKSFKKLVLYRGKIQSLSIQVFIYLYFSLYL